MALLVSLQVLARSQTPPIPHPHLSQLRYITSPPPGRKPRGLLGRLSPSALLARPPPAIAVDDDIGGDDFGRIAQATDGKRMRCLACAGTECDMFDCGMGVLL